jgi:hypothetical protein
MSDLIPVAIEIIDPAKFHLGRIVATPNALDHLPNDEILFALGRHSQADWGALDPEDKRANDRALIEGTRLLSAYNTKSGIRFWIITEHGRSVTTILLPEDY